MIDELRTLVALNDLKTMLKTATYLRVTQSTVSKRIQHLEEITQQEIVVPSGRRIELTDYGRHLALEAPKVLQDLEQLLLPHPTHRTDMPKLIIGVGESILTSWAARSLVKFEKRKPKTQLEVPCPSCPSHPGQNFVRESFTWAYVLLKKCPIQHSISKKFTRNLL